MEGEPVKFFLLSNEKEIIERDFCRFGQFFFSNSGQNRQKWRQFEKKSGHVGSSLAPHCLQERPKRLQESSKRLPRGLKRLQEALQEASRRPPGCQDASKSSTRGSRNGLGMILGTIWKHFLQMLDCYASRLAARCQQDGGRRHGAKPFR